MFRHSGLLDRSYLRRAITREAPWREGHGATDDFLGSGMLYYAVAYAMKARVAVCLGSGGGFVPRLLRQAQRDAGIASESTVILIDGNCPQAGWGSPRWLSSTSFFRRAFPDVRILVETTEVAATRLSRENVRIDYLHIDADHSYAGARTDFDRYLPLLADHFVITFHDTDEPGVDQLLLELRQRDDLDVVNIPEIGRGVAIARPRRGRTAPKFYEPYFTPRVTEEGDRPAATRRAIPRASSLRRAVVSVVESKAIRGCLAVAEAAHLRRFHSPRFAPIFIVGPARSGTTLVYQAMTTALRVSYFSNLMARFPRSPVVAGMFEHWAPRPDESLRFVSQHGRSVGAAAPAQGYEIWSRWFPRAGDGTDLSNWNHESIDQACRTIAGVESWGKGPFLNKWPGHVAHWRALVEAFPRAVFVRIDRDPVATSASVLAMRRDLTGDERASVSRAPAGYDVYRDRDGVTQACGYVRSVKGEWDAAASELGVDRFFYVNFADFCQQPRAILESLREWHRQLTGEALATRGAIPDRFEERSSPIPGDVKAVIETFWARSNALDAA